MCALCVRAGAQECYNASPSLLSDPLRPQCSPVPRPASLRISREFWSWTQIPYFPDGQWSHGLLIAVLPTISVCGDAKTWVNCPDNCHCDHWPPPALDQGDRIISWRRILNIFVHPGHRDRGGHCTEENGILLE